jgi:hypothetical protein
VAGGRWQVEGESRVRCVDGRQRKCRARTNGSAGQASEGYMNRCPGRSDLAHEAEYDLCRDTVWR